MRGSLRFPGGRFGAALALAGLSVGIGIVAFANPTVPADTVSAIGYWRFEVSTSGLLILLAVVLRGRPGLAYPALAFASASIAGDLEAASYAARSVEAIGTVGSPAYADVLLGFAVFVRTAVPAAILTLYASAPQRRLGRWVGPLGLAITVASATAPFLRVARDAAGRAEVWTTPWWNELSFQLDQPMLVLLIATLGFLGALRADARSHAPSMPTDSTAPAPDRRLLSAGAIVIALWVPATLAYLNRPASAGELVEGEQIVWIPILCVLIGLVSSRWSRVIAWISMAAAFEAVAAVVLYRAVADYLAVYMLQPPGTDIGIPAGFALLNAATLGVVLFGFASVSVALLAAWRPIASTAADECRWALVGSAAGAALYAWFIGGGLLGAGVSIVMGVVFLPAYVMPIAVAIVAWRRLVPAVAEAEKEATQPFRPLQYLETVVTEVLTGRAEDRRRTVSAERARLSTELADLRATIGRLLVDQTLVLEPAISGGGGWALGATSGLRPPSAREVDVIRLLVRGSTNEEIAGELVLSLKTVESHLRRLFARYGVANRTELAVLAVRAGWVESS